jgi:purine-binding chemotaxis protein CheW
MNGVPTLLLPVGHDLYALPVEWAREVVAAPAVTRLATAPAVVLGLFNLRGQIVPLLDTATLLDVGPAGPMAFAVVVNCTEGPVGLATTAIPQRAVLESSIGPSELAGTAGLYQVGQRVAALLDPGTLFTPDRVAGRASRGDLLTAAGH